MSDRGGRAVSRDECEDAAAAHSVELQQSGRDGIESDAPPIDAPSEVVSLCPVERSKSAIRSRYAALKPPEIMTLISAAPGTPISKRRKVPASGALAKALRDREAIAARGLELALELAALRAQPVELLGGLRNARQELGARLRRRTRECADGDWDLLRHRGHRWRRRRRRHGDGLKDGHGRHYE